MHIQGGAYLGAAKHSSEAGVNKRAVGVLVATLVPPVGTTDIDVRNPGQVCRATLVGRLVQPFAGQGDLGVLLPRQAQDRVESDGQHLHSRLWRRSGHDVRRRGPSRGEWSRVTEADRHGLPWGFDAGGRGAASSPKT